jgi:hypothetical protein
VRISLICSVTALWWGFIETPLCMFMFHVTEVDENLISVVQNNDNFLNLLFS